MKSFAEMKAERDQQEAARLAALEAERAGASPQAAAPGQEDPARPVRRIAGGERPARDLPSVPEAAGKEDRQLEMGGSSSVAEPSGPVEPPPAWEARQPAVAKPPAAAARRDPPSGIPAETLAMTEEQRDAYWDDERKDAEAEQAAEAERRVMERLEKEGRLRDAKRTGRKRGKVAPSVPTTRVRDIPTCLVDRARSLFPGERIGDSVAAYIYMGEGCPEDLTVTPAIRELVDRYAGKTVTLETVQAQMAKELQRLQNQQRFFTAKMEAVELAVAYMAFKAAGFSCVDAPSPEAMDFLVKGIDALMGRLELQAGLKHQRDLVREGRPKRS